jgi:beta-glucanase (GH16 family)
VHWDNAGSNANYGGKTSLPFGIFNDEYHVFSIIWDAEKIVWLLDNVQYHVIDIRPVELNEFQKPFFFILNVAVGGTWPGIPDGSTVFPQEMKVDYIRVFQKK